MKKPLQQICYEGYRAKTGGVSLATGNPIPEWAELSVEIKEAWAAASSAVLFAGFQQLCDVVPSLVKTADLLHRASQITAAHVPQP